MSINKILKLRKLISMDFDGVLALIISPVNRYYLSGFCSSAGWIVILKNKSYLLLDQRYYGAATSANLIANFEIVCTKDFFKTLKNIVKKNNVKTVLLEEDFVTLKLLYKIKNVLKSVGCIVKHRSNLSNAVSKIRAKKNDDEIKNIKNSQRILETGFNHILKLIKPGVTELELATELEFFVRKLGAKSAAFDFIIASGSNSAVPHSSVSSKKISENDIVLIDIGVNFNGYMCDMTRTVFVGSSSSKQREVYGLVLEAQKLAINNIKPGVMCSKIDSIVRNFIDSTKYKGTFLHSLGHGVGLEIHEKPFIAKNSKDVFKEGMVATIEPGIYINGEFGVRIEDMVLITENGCENLTTTPKNIVVL